MSDKALSSLTDAGTLQASDTMYDIRDGNSRRATIDGLSSDALDFLQAGTGAVTRTVQDKLEDIVSVFDFMTAAEIADVKARTLSVNVTTAVQAALTAACGDSDSSA